MKDEDILSAILAAAIIGSRDEEAQTPEVRGAELRKKAEDLGNSYYHLYLGFKDAGFTDEQAFQLMLNTVRRN